MERVIITGATSLLGVALIKECIKNGVFVYAVSRCNSEKKSRFSALENINNIKFIECDLQNLKNLDVIDRNCDTFYHIAWENTGRGFVQQPWLQIDNIKYEMEAVELAKKCGCKKFIGCGSQAEYGYVNRIINKDTIFNPNIAYGYAKHAAAGLSRILCKEYGIIHIWGRIFSMYGCNEGEHTVFNYAIKSFLKREDAYFSNGTQLWDYLNEKDAGKMFYILGDKCNKSKDYIIAHGKSRPLREYIEILAKEMNALALCHFGFNNEVNHPSIQADISEFVNDFGYKPQILFEDGVKKMINAYINNIAVPSPPRN